MMGCDSLIEIGMVFGICMRSVHTAYPLRSNSSSLSSCLMSHRKIDMTIQYQLTINIVRAFNIQFIAYLFSSFGLALLKTHGRCRDAQRRA